MACPSQEEDSFLSLPPHIPQFAFAFFHKI